MLSGLKELMLLPDALLGDLSNQTEIKLNMHVVEPKIVKGNQDNIGQNKVDIETQNNTYMPGEEHGKYLNWE